MKDYTHRNKVIKGIEDVRYWWKRLKLKKKQLPPGFDVEELFRYIVEHTPVPEVRPQRVDELIWERGITALYVCFPDGKDGVGKYATPSYTGFGFQVESPNAKHKAWKVDCNQWTLDDVLKRFDLGSYFEIVDMVITVTHQPQKQKDPTAPPRITYRRYPSELAAKQAVEAALLKLKLVGPVPDVDEMHELTGYDS